MIGNFKIIEAPSIHNAISVYRQCRMKQWQLAIIVIAVILL